MRRKQAKSFNPEIKFDSELTNKCLNTKNIATEAGEQVACIESADFYG